MSQRVSFPAVLASLLLATMPAFSQTEEGGRSEVSAQFAGTFTHNSNQSGVQQSSSNSGGLLLSYRFLFSTHHAIEGTYGYSRTTIDYSSTSGLTGTQTNRHEWTGAYVFRMPIRKVTPFLQAGVGGVTYAPTNSHAAQTQSRAAFVYGGGVDFNVTHHVFVRAQYRGLVLSSPTFDLLANAGNDRVTHIAEPSIGIGIKF